MCLLNIHVLTLIFTMKQSQLSFWSWRCLLTPKTRRFQGICLALVDWLSGNWHQLQGFPYSPPKGECIQKEQEKSPFPLKLYFLRDLLKDLWCCDMRKHFFFPLRSTTELLLPFVWNSASDDGTEVHIGPNLLQITTEALNKNKQQQKPTDN